MIDYNGRFCMSSAATAGNRAFGIDRGLPFPLADLAEAEAILLVGSNPAATMPPAMQFFDAGRAAGATAHRRRPAPHRHRRRLERAPAAGARHRPRAGERPAAHRDPGGLVDEDYIAARTRGFAAVKAGVASYWPDRVERITGVAVADLLRARCTPWPPPSPR